jgi:hypothetical protein
MKLVVHPKCCGCGKLNPDFESERFALRVCRQCLGQMASWLVKRGVDLDDNILATELFDGVFKWSDALDSSEHFTLIVSLYESNAYSYVQVKRYVDSK